MQDLTCSGKTFGLLPRLDLTCLQNSLQWDLGCAWLHCLALFSLLFLFCLYSRCAFVWVSCRTMKCLTNSNVLKPVDTICSCAPCDTVLRFTESRTDTWIPADLGSNHCRSFSCLRFLSQPSVQFQPIKHTWAILSCFIINIHFNCNH